MKSCYKIIFFFSFFNVIDAQFYDHNIGFKYLSVDTSWQQIYFCYAAAGDKGIITCEPSELFSYNGGCIIDCYGDADYSDTTGLILNFEKSHNINATFEKLYWEIKKDTYLFKSREYYVITHHKDNRFVISCFEKGNFIDYKFSKVVSFNRVLLDGKYPFLMAFTNNDKTDYIITFFDSNHKFHHLDNQANEAILHSNEEVKLSKTGVQEAIKNWQDTADTIRYNYFNGQNHSFSTDNHFDDNLETIYDDKYTIEGFKKIKSVGDHNTIFNISDIKKYNKGALLKAVKGKVFNEGSIKFFNENGGALFVNHNTKYNNSFIKYFKEIELLENVTILYNGEFTLVPFHDHFKLISTDGKIYENIDLDFILGNNYKRRILTSLEDLLIYKANNKWGVKDRLNLTDILPTLYDSIHCSRNPLVSGVFVAEKGKTLEIFNALFEKIYSSNWVRDYSISEQYIQINENNKIFYLTTDGTKSNTLPIFGIIICETDLEPDKIHLEKSKNANEYNIFNSNNFIDWNVDNQKLFTRNNIGSIKIFSDSIHFVNGKNDFVSYYSDYNWQNYILSYNKRKTDLIRLEFIPKDSIYVQTSIIKADEFIFADYQQPLMYRIDNLWAYFGINAFPKYKSISPFVGHFARIQDAKGNFGWINRYGKEFWD